MDILAADALFFQLTAILVMAGGLGFLAVKFKQPLIVAFILAGVLAGPDVLNIVSEHNNVIIETLAGFGVALLLFVVGLKLDLRLIRQMSFSVLIIGLAQIFLTFSLGTFLALFLKFDFVSAAFIGMSLAFSSTIIVVKLLSDQRTIDSLYGRLSLGVLIIQDLVVIFATIAIAAFAGGSEGYADLVILPVKIFALIIFSGLFIRYVANPLTGFLARNSELMVIFCIAFAVFMAALCEYFHLGKELGGLMAGIVLASTSYNNIIAARLSVLRDFLLLFFFANLGANMSLENMSSQIVPALILSLFVLSGKSVIIMGIMNAMRYRKRTGFMTGLTLSQISEFSLILMVMGLSAGFVSQGAMNLIMLTGLITMGLSTYAISYSSRLYSFLEGKIPLLVDNNSRYQEEADHHEIEEKYDVIIFGLGRYGHAMAQLFQKKGFSVLGIDFNPEIINEVRESGIPVIYGDASDPDFPAHLLLDDTKVIIFSFHHHMTGPLITDLRRTLARFLREQGYDGHIAATSHHPEHDRDLPQCGIDIILSPFEDAAFHGTEQIIDIFEHDKD